MPRLIAIDGTEFEVRRKKTSIGRIPSNDIYLPDLKISRNHAQLIYDGKNYRLVDNMSLNGTYVNGTRIDEVQLADGDEIKMGSWVLHFRTTDTSPQLASNGDTVFQFTRTLDHVRAKEGEQSGERISAILEAAPDDPGELRASHRNLQVLQQLSRAINTTLDLDKQFEATAELILDSLPCRMMSISLLSEQDDKLIPQTVHSRTGQPVPDHAFIESIAQRTIKEQVCIAAYNPQGELPPGAPRVGSVMSVPLWAEERVIGLVYIENSPDKKPYSESELDLLIAMAGTISSAVQNARLHQQVIEALVRIQEQQKLLVQSEKLAGIGTLAAGVAHEINNPLAGIMGMAEAAISTDSIDKVKACAEDIIHYAETASHIVRDLQNYSRIAPEGPLEPVNIEDVISSALRLADHSGLMKDVGINRDKGDVTYVMAEPSQLRQVFLNLIQNAVQAMGGKGEITISTWMEGDDVYSEVTDTGPGIPPEQIDRIFDPFFSTKKVGEGTGLGLAVTMSIVNRFEGTITCESSRYSGAVFTLSFPAGNKTE